MRSRKYINTVRRLLKRSNYLVTLIEAYRTDNLTEVEKEHLWIGIQDLALKLANKHYKDKQFISTTNLFKSRETIPELKQAIRVDLFYSIIREYDKKNHASGVLYVIHKKFCYLELLVECKLIGYNFLPNKTDIQKIRCGFIEELMIGVKLYNLLSRENNRIPTFNEVIIEYAAFRIAKNKLVGWDDLKRFTSRFKPYLTLKNAFYHLEYNEEWVDNGHNNSPF